MALTVTLTFDDDEEKALEYTRFDVEDYYLTIARQTLKHSLLGIIPNALSKGTNGKNERILTDEEISYFQGKIGFVTDYSSIPIETQLEIVNKANIYSAAERMDPAFNPDPVEPIDPDPTDPNLGN